MENNIDNRYKDLIWSAAQSSYEYEREEFNANWKMMKIIYITLLCLGVLPGIIYGWVFYNTKEAKRERSKAANKFIFKAINKLDRVENRIEVINAHSVNQDDPDYVKLPFSKLHKLVHRFDYEPNKLKRWRIRFDTDMNRNAPYIAQQMESYGLLKELTGRRDGMTGFAAKHLGNDGKLLYRDALVTSTGVASVKLESGEMIQFANAKVKVKEEFEVEVDNRTERQTKTLTLWSGLVAFTSLKTSYPHSFKVASKDFSTKRDKNYPDDQSPIQYELESSIFTDEFDLTTTKEEPVKLRKQFSVNNLAHLVDLKTNTAPFIMTSQKGGDGVAFAFDSTTGGRNDLPFNVEQPWKFFKDKEYAKQVLNDEFSTLLHTIQEIANLVDDKFMKNDVKVTIKK
ncbi:MAG: hypothetical protein KAG91_01665 [Mycoplasmataceae bacterium]|nr:hypothetical protein [Mycoplasmataceae bacterium]